MEELTQQQRKVFNFICNTLQKRGASPSFREIQSHFGFASLKGVYGHVQALIKKEFLEQTHRFRGLKPLKEFAMPELSQLIATPECLAAVPMGNPAAVFEDVADVHWFSKSLTGPGEFCLFHVKGESMIKRGILPGDLVVARKQNTAEVGDIVVAVYKECVTLKKYGRDSKGNHLLIPENDHYEKMVIPKEDPDFLIGGKMMFFIRMEKNLKSLDEIQKMAGRSKPSVC